jgi:hypothetical protein
MRPLLEPPLSRGLPGVQDGIRLVNERLSDLTTAVPEDDEFSTVLRRRMGMFLWSRRKAAHAVRPTPRA